MNASFRARYGPWAVVAGASEGIGESFAKRLAERGVNLVLIARRGELLRRLAGEIAARYGVEARPLALDLAGGGLREAVEEGTRGLDVGLLVYNAAYSPIGPFTGRRVEDLLRVVDLNCRGPLLLAHLFGRRMEECGRGGIILMSSLTGFQGTAMVAAYGASKAFNLVLAEGLWEELRGKGVDVLACCAGATRTPGYTGSRPSDGGLFGPPVMEPGDVAGEALAALGRQPVLIPGRTNRLASLLMRRLLPRSRAVSLLGRAMRRLYEPGKK